jgi:succinate dehydrogenase / fumarate reductase flavoprotein subunit
MNGSGAYQVQQELQSMMQDLVGIVRNAPEMERALEGIERLKQRTAAVGVMGNREYNPGWHTALDLTNLLTISEAIARSAIERKESRGGHFREDFPEKDAAHGKFNLVIRQGRDGKMQLSREPIPEMPAELKRVIEEQK